MRQKIKVLVIEPEGVTAAALGADDGFEVHACASLGASWERSDQPDLVLVAHSLGPSACGALTARWPAAPLYLLHPAPSRAAGHEAKEWGAQGVLPQPATPADVRRTLGIDPEPGREVVVLPQNVFLVYGPKGGTGKTTFAINLAAAIRARLGDRDEVAIVDGDLPWGTVGDILRLRGEKSWLDWADAAGAMSSLDPLAVRARLARHESGLYVLQCGDPAERLAAMAQDQDLLRGVLEAIVRSFTVVVLDFSDAMAHVFEHVARLSRSIVVVTDLREESVIRTVRAMNTMGFRRFLSETRVTYGGLVVTQPDAGSGREYAPAEVAALAKLSLLGQIPYDPRQKEARKLGVPLVLRWPKSPAARAVNQIMDKLVPGLGGVPKHRRFLFGGRR